MVFVSKNIERKCKYCDKPPKKNLTSGKNKGYYRTCGSKECLRKQYDDHHVCVKKSRLVKPINMICAVCNETFLREKINHKRFCLKCVPDKSWRTRAMRYGIGKPQWDQMLTSQNGKCALCDRNPEVVDHCHKRGRVRGLLCQACNMAISILDTTDEFIEKALKYVGKI